jgi:Flp pilus assembly pilin Flp
MPPTKLRARLAELRIAESGQTLVEYALLGVLVSIAAIAFLAAVGLDLSEAYDAVENLLGVGGDNTVSTPVGEDDTAAPLGAA